MNNSARFDALLAYIQSSTFPSQMSRQPQLGLYYLAQHATDAGYQVRVDELSAGDQVVRRLCWLADEYAFPLLGLYVDHDNIWDLRRILSALKQERPEFQIVLGGPEMTANAEGTMARLPQAISGCIRSSAALRNLTIWCANTTPRTSASWTKRSSPIRGGCGRSAAG